LWIGRFVDCLWLGAGPKILKLLPRQAISGLLEPEAFEKLRSAEDFKRIAQREAERRADLAYVEQVAAARSRQDAAELADAQLGVWLRLPQCMSHDEGRIQSRCPHPIALTYCWKRPTASVLDWEDLTYDCDVGKTATSTVAPGSKNVRLEAMAWHRNYTVSKASLRILTACQVESTGACLKK
jgi:hypothetical protein